MRRSAGEGGVAREVVGKQNSCVSGEKRMGGVVVYVWKEWEGGGRLGW